jgi:hypothetical protein
LEASFHFHNPFSVVTVVSRCVAAKKTTNKLVANTLLPFPLSFFMGSLCTFPPVKSRLPWSRGKEEGAREEESPHPHHQLFLFGLFQEEEKGRAPDRRWRE